jgi:hypothetical protein
VVRGAARGGDSDERVRAVKQERLTIASATKGGAADEVLIRLHVAEIELKTTCLDRLGQTMYVV